MSKCDNNDNDNNATNKDDSSNKDDIDVGDAGGITNINVIFVTAAIHFFF